MAIVNRLRDVKTVFFDEPVVFKGSFCDAFDGFIHNYVSDTSYDTKMSLVVDFHLMEIVGK